MKIGIIGYGYWGPNLVRNFASLNNCTVKAVADSRRERLELLSKNYPAIQTFTNPDDIILDTEIDAVVIATPVSTHYNLALKCLSNAKHTLIEKPMTSSTKEAEELINLAIQKNKILMIDHTFLYNSAVIKMKEIIDSGSIGNVKYFDSNRINLGLFQPDINVLWDLSPHDISILNYLHNEEPYSINATGVSHTTNGIENIAYMTVNFNSKFIAHFNCSWTSPVKIRMTLIGGDKKMIVYNDIEPTEKIKIYDTGYSCITSDYEKMKILVDYRTGDIQIPKIENREALSGMARDFINSIISGKEPISSCYSGLKVVKILEAAQKSLKNKGKEIKL